jgi:hypothetical protein
MSLAKINFYSFTFCFFFFLFLFLFRLSILHLSSLSPAIRTTQDAGRGNPSASQRSINLVLASLAIARQMTMQASADWVSSSMAIPLAAHSRFNSARESFVDSSAHAAFRTRLRPTDNSM